MSKIRWQHDAIYKEQYSYDRQTNKENSYLLS